VSPSETNVSSSGYGAWTQVEYENFDPFGAKMVVSCPINGVIEDINMEISKAFIITVLFFQI